MMKQQSFAASCLLAAAMLSACSSDDVQTPAEPMRPISVEVNQRPMKTDGATSGESQVSRADITTTETLANFSFRGIYGGGVSEYTASKSVEAWTVTPDVWPGAPNGSKVPFYAFTGGTFQSNSDNPYINFTASENASTQHDLLVATNSVAYNDHQGKVPLSFDHACAAVVFSVQMTKALQTQLAGKHLSVSSIVLRNASKSGRYYFEASTWKDVGTSTYYTLHNSDLLVTTEAQLLSCGHLFLIPQTRAANGTEGTYIEVSYAFSGQKESSAVIPLDVNWQAGTEYPIDIRLGTTLIK